MHHYFSADLSALRKNWVFILIIGFFVPIAIRSENARLDGLQSFLGGYSEFELVFSVTTFPNPEVIAHAKKQGFVIADDPTCLYYRFRRAKDGFFFHCATS